MPIKLFLPRWGAKSTCPSWLTKSLDVAKESAFKIWRLSPLLKVISAVMAVLTIFAVGWLAWTWRNAEFFRFKGVVAALSWTALAVLIGSLGLGLLVKVIRYRKTIHQILLGMMFCLVGTFVAKTHLTIFDPWFRREGRFPREPNS